jgi:stage II sporulation protein D
VGKGAQRRWIFYGRGWGHGVGMDQTGAYGMALEGSTFEQILKHYYTGIELTKQY